MTYLVNDEAHDHYGEQSPHSDHILADTTHFIVHLTDAIESTHFWPEHVSLILLLPLSFCVDGATLPSEVNNRAEKEGAQLE